MTEPDEADKLLCMNSQIPNFGRFLVEHGRFDAFWQGSAADLSKRLPFFHVRFRLTGPPETQGTLARAAEQLQIIPGLVPQIWWSEAHAKAGLNVDKVGAVALLAEMLRKGFEQSAASVFVDAPRRLPVAEAWLECTDLMAAAIRARNPGKPYRARDHYADRLNAVDKLQRLSRRLPPAPIPTEQETP